MPAFAKRECIYDLDYYRLTVFSYKPEVRLRFVTEELAFEHDEEAAQFVLDHAPDGVTELLQEKEGHVRLMTGKVGTIFETAKAAAFRQVDIKGQI